MSASTGTAVIREDTVLKGDIRNGKLVEVFGYIEGELQVEQLIIRPGGKVFGTINVGAAEVHGTFQGHASVKNLMSIRKTGSVSGNVRYGRLAMEDGGNLSADVRNIPPDIAGDLDITVRKGSSARVTTMDLTAIDPDDDATDLTYTVSNPVNGNVIMNGAPTTPIENFTQADLENGKIMFHHDGSNTTSASFSVIVTDAKGATSGDAKTVKVAVTA